VKYALLPADDGARNSERPTVRDNTEMSGQRFLFKFPADRT